MQGPIRQAILIAILSALPPATYSAALRWTGVRHACTGPNQGEVTARLDGIPWAQSWEDTCEGRISGQKPPDLNQHGASGQPKSCRKDPLSTGIWGKWTVANDKACPATARWEDPKYWKKAGCFGPDKQVYSARLLDSRNWEADCGKTDISKVAGKEDWGVPDRCAKDALATGIWGEWYRDEACAVPLKWGSFRDNGCVADMESADANAGGISLEGKRSYSSVLWNAGGDWGEACKFAPAAVVDAAGQAIADFEHPTACVVADADRAMGYVIGAILGAAGGLVASPASPKAAIAVGAVVGVAGTAATEAILAGVNTSLNVWGIFWADDETCGTVPSYPPLDDSGFVRLATGQIVAVDVAAPADSGAIAGASARAAAAPASLPSCPDTVESLRGSGSTLTCSCTAAQAGSGNVWGVGPYTDDSRICRAAVHSGVIASSGGAIEVQAVSGQAQYQGSSRNGVTTEAYGNWPGSVAVRRPR